MSVLKSRRKQSGFEVFHHFYYMRTEIMNFVLGDFGFSLEKAKKKVSKQFGGKSPEELNEADRAHYETMLERDEKFGTWFVVDERQAIINCLRNLGTYIFSANDICPLCQEELTQRRLYQERALGCCEMLEQELQFTIQTLPVDINKYTRFADMIEKEKGLIKGWRKSDNRLKKNFSENQ